MAITLKGTPQTVSVLNGAVSSVTFGTPPANGDTVIVIGGNGTTATGSVIGPSTAGYTSCTTFGSIPRVGAWYKTMGASPDTSVAMVGDANASDGSCYIVLVVSGVIAGSPFDNGIPSSTTATPQSMTTTVNGAWIFQVYANNTVTPPTGVPTGYTDLGSANEADTNKLAIRAAYKQKSPAGADAASAWPGSSGTAIKTFSFAFKPASFGATAFEGWGVPL